MTTFRKVDDYLFPFIELRGGNGSYIKAAVLTTAQRDALPSPAAGYFIYNSTTGQLENYNGSAWVAFLSLTGGEMSGNITFSGAQTVDGVDVSAHAADLVAHMESPLRRFRTGQDIFPLPVQSQPAGSAIAANTLYAWPFIPVRDMTISAFKVRVSSAGAESTQARLGIYNNGSNLYPGSLHTDLGLIAVDSTGVKTITPASAIAFTKGLYWLTLVSDGTPTFNFMIPTIYVLGATDPSSLSVGWNVAFTFAVLEDPFPVGASIETAKRVGWTLTLDSLD